VKLSAFDYSLPPELIAQHPLPERDQSRMMVVRRRAGTFEHRRFCELPELLGPEHFLVLNNTRVFPARLWAHRPGKREQVEILLLREEAPGSWLALLRPGRKAQPGQELLVEDLRARVLDVRDSGSRLLLFSPAENLRSSVERLGRPPLPPYIHRQPGEDPSDDSERYQTIYARHTGSIAAPTAGLHFTTKVLERLEGRGISRCEILLHVGYGTFQPVRSAVIENHRIEPEYFEIGDDSAAFIQGAKRKGKHLIAVGSTTTRVLEYVARSSTGFDKGSSGYCDLFIYPGFDFRVLDGLLTNFHLPRSTLFMLVCAFASRELMLQCYREAIAQKYRFYSYGDCMLIL